MNRTILYTIQPTDQGLRIEQFLKRKGYSSQNFVQLKKMPDSILVNGHFALFKQVLNSGDVLTVAIREQDISPHIEPVSLPLSIVYEDEDIIVLNKTAGMPVHPSIQNYTNTMANALAFYYQEQGKPFVFRCSNRLDRDTSGLTVVAKHLVSGSILSTRMCRKEIHRQYLAIVSGTPAPAEGRITAPLGRLPGSIIQRQVDYENGEPAITNYRVLESRNGHSLVSLILETGRTHQIRIHMKSIGNPLIGDYLYHPDMTYIHRQALHACRLSFAHPITGEWMDFSAPLPDDMRQVLNTLDFSIPDIP